MERWIESGSEIARLSAEGTTTYWTGALARGAAPWDVFDDVRRWWTEASRRERPQLALAQRDRARVPRRPPARLLAGLDGRRGADAGAAAAGRPRLLHRRLLPHAEPDEGHQGRRAGARVLARVDRRHRRDQRRRDRGLPGLRRALDRAHRRPGQPDRRLPGRLAGRDLRGAAPRARQHADARGRADRLPRRRRRDRRLGRGARQRRPRVLPLGRRAGRRRAQGRAHAQRLHPDQAGERDRQAGAADERTSTTPSTSSATTTSRRGSSTCRTSRARSTSGSSSTCSWRTGSSRARWRSAASASTSRGSTARCSCSAARATTSRRPRRCSPRPTTSAHQPADVEKHVNSGGHLGLFMGSEALREHWPPILAAVYERSRRNADTAAAKSRARNQTPRKRPAIPAP